MCALSLASRCGSAVFVNSQVPRTLICCMRSKRLVGRSAVEARLIALALLSTTSMPPNAATASATARWTSASSRTSPTTGRALPPAARIASAAV